MPLRLGTNYFTGIWDQKTLLRTEVPEEELIWQDPVKTEIPITMLIQSGSDQEGGLTIQELVETAQEITYRHTDMRGGANGARIRLAPKRLGSQQNSHQPSKVLGVPEPIAESSGASVADVIVGGLKLN